MNVRRAIVAAYHQRSKHALQRYAAGPQTLDWDSQPDPFRRFDGAPLTWLPLAAARLAPTWDDLFVPGRIAPAALTRDSLAALLELSVALTAWKTSGPDRWSVRANPSSGNLHPTEVYVLAHGVAGLDDGLHHYQPREHALALRRRADPPCASDSPTGPGTSDTTRTPDAAGTSASRAASGAAPSPGLPDDDPPALWLGLASIHWREAWKYGERAFRYCQLDVGHALGALRYAAAVLGWQARRVDALGHEQCAALLGLDRDADFGAAEREEPELLLHIGPGRADAPGAVPPAPGAATAWHGVANRLDAHPMYRWPVIAEVAHATRGGPAAAERAPSAEVPVAACTPARAGTVGAASASARDGDGDGDGDGSHASCARVDTRASRGPAARAAAAVILGRRSARHFDRRAHMPRADFERMLQALLPAAGLPWDLRGAAPARVHLVLWAHRVDSLAPGAYLLPRSERGAGLLAALASAAGCVPAPPLPASVPALRELALNAALAGSLRTLSCHQAIASDACFAVSMLADFDDALQREPAFYRALLQEAGLLGQVLYDEAEAAGYRGTGIGCYFDDAVHDLLGLAGTALQVVYHFTVGVPLADDRLEQTAPPYAGRAPVPLLQEGGAP